MNKMIENFDPEKIAKDLFNEIQKVEIKNTPNLRAIRKKYSQELRDATPKQILVLVRHFINNYNYRWIGFELIRYHRATINTIGVKELREFGKEMNNWGAVDTFAGLLAGPAWCNGQVTNELILSWALSKDRWWRRIALVSTVPLNRRSLGGRGDISRTLAVCRLLVADKDDMVIKALSWALRELIPHDPESVRVFISENEWVLASRVKREVKNKLTTGLKNPKRKR